MTQPADIQPLPIEQILEILQKQAIATPNPSTSSRYLRALQSFQSSVISYQSLDSSLLTLDSLQLRCTDWLVSLWLTATPFTTASLYLDIISSLYGSAAKADLLPKTNLFSQLKTSLKALGPEGWRQGIDDEIFARALRLTKNASHLIADDHTAAQLVLYSLTHGLLPLTDIAMLKRSDAKESRDNSSLIIHHSSLKRARYLFPLRQSQRTPRQLQAHISDIVNALFRRARLPQATDPYQTVEALWAYAALRAGIPASRLVAHLRHVPLGLPVLKLSNVEGAISERAKAVEGPISERAKNVESPISERAKNVESAISERALDSSLLTLNPSKEDFSQVGKIFLENPPRWYAMQLRPGVRFTQLCRRIDQLRTTSPLTLDSSPLAKGLGSSPLAEGLELFYPSEEIARVIGKKIVTRQRPFIHSVVFFRAKLTDIGRLFSKIGDLAWCYRASARPGAPYADISDRQFRLFQQTIARFTPDYEVAASGDLELREGDRVEILGGLFAGQTATVIEGSRVKSQEPSARTIYRLNLIGDNSIDWRISVDSRLLKAHNEGISPGGVFR